jgi:hypothetical protein
MTPPIFLDNKGDLSVFDSIELAEGYVEAIDVRNDEYVGYDSEGRLLSFRIVPGPGAYVEYVKIEDAEATPSRSAELRAKIISYLVAVGYPEKDLQNLSLREVVEKSLKCNVPSSLWENLWPRWLKRKKKS